MPCSNHDNEEEYSVIPVIPMEDAPVHTLAHPFCDDPRCPCHEDPALIQPLAEAVQDGLLTPEEATGIVNNKTI